MLVEGSAFFLLLVYIFHIDCYWSLNRVNITNPMNSLLKIVLREKYHSKFQ